MSSPPRTAVVIANPAARRALPPHVLETAAEAMRPRGWDIRVEVATTRQEAGERAARHAREGVDALLACGGDGSLTALITGVRGAGTGSLPALGIVPAGTANVWAAAAGVPRDPTRALALLEDGDRRPVDLGFARIGAEEAVPFLLVCGAGLDATVVAAVEARPAWKRRVGRLAYGPPALAALATWPPIDTRIDLDGVEVHAPRLLLALAANAPRYGGVAALTARNAVDDGLLEITLFEGGRSLAARAALVLQMLRGGLDDRPVRGVTQRQARRVTLTPTRPLPVEADGDVIGVCGPDAPLQIEVAPRAVTMIVGR